MGRKVGRASASAVAFGMGLYRGVGSLGPARLQPFALSSQPEGSDRHLRFHRVCEAYEAAKRGMEAGVVEGEEAALKEVLEGVRMRLGMGCDDVASNDDVASRDDAAERDDVAAGDWFTMDDVATLWRMCKFEVAVFGRENGSCALLTAPFAAKLEWVDDRRTHFLKGYGAVINYRIAEPLLADVLQSMEVAAESGGGPRGGGRVEGEGAVTVRACGDGAAPHVPPRPLLIRSEGGLGRGTGLR